MALITADGTLQLNSNNVNNCRAPVGTRCIPRGDFMYFRDGQDEVGDVRVKFSDFFSVCFAHSYTRVCSAYNTHDYASIIAQQRGDVLKEWKSPKVGGIFISFVDFHFERPRKHCSS